MTSDPQAGRRPRRLSPELRDRETVKPLELYFDLVFVLGFTQCTALMSAESSWEGIIQGLLVLAMLWWTWAGYAWLTSVVEPEEGAVRIVMFAAMAALLVVALCVPQAFGDRALAFALAYGLVRIAHIGVFAIAGRDDPNLSRAVAGLALSSAIAIGLLLIASLLDGVAQGAVWMLAIAIDWGWYLVVGMEGWRLVPGHFAERYNLVIILALGESIVALGVGADVALTAGVVTASVLGVALASALWWTYFDIVALVTARRLAEAPEGVVRNLLARDSYSYLHYPMVAGIVLAAFGLEYTLAHVSGELDGVHAFALLGGVSIYLLAHVVLRLRNAHTLNRQRLLLAIVLLALIPVATGISALASLAGVCALIWAMIAYEHSTYDQRRWRLRHGLDPWSGDDAGGAAA